MENSLVLNLLSSPEALEFALKHQKHKVEELQQTTATLLSSMIQAGILPSYPASPGMLSSQPPSPDTSPGSSPGIYPSSPPQHFFPNNHVQQPTSPYLQSPQRIKQPKEPAKAPEPFKFPEPIKVYPAHNGTIPAYITPPFPAFPTSDVTPDHPDKSIPVRHKLHTYPPYEQHQHQGKQTIPVIKKEATPNNFMSVQHILNQPSHSSISSQLPKFPKLEIVVEGDMANIDPELLTSTLWDSDSDSVGENDIPSSYPNQRCSKKKTPYLNKTFDNRNNLSADWYTVADLPPSEEDPGVVWEWKNALNGNKSSFMQWKNAVDYTKSRRFRTKIEPHMLSHLEEMYQRKHFISCEERKGLADLLGMTERAVVYWFQNRRRKDMRNYHNSMVA